WLRTELRQPGFVEARTTGFIKPQFNIFPLLVQVNPPQEQPVVGYREVKVPVGVDRTFLKRLYVSLGYTVQLENPFAYVGALDQDLSTVVLSFPELVTHLDLRDDPVRPHEGAYVGATVSKAGGIFGGSADDFRVQPEVRTYLPISDGVTFATRASVGFLWASNYGRDWGRQLTDSNQTAFFPPGSNMSIDGHTRKELANDTQIMYFRGFFSGGPTTNRGYPLLGVSPHGVIPFLNPANASQQVMFKCDPPTLNAAQMMSPQAFEDAVSKCYLPVGGFTLWELQNEVRFDVSGPLSATVFCDMSDVSAAVTTFRFDHLHLSCGGGIAYDTPVGAIRADIGYRIPPLQVLGHANEQEAAAADPREGLQPTILGIPIALAIGIGRAY
ncbi:MAG: BamA/TamA family outer membrane protein, partial [Myxococcales bacterium]|nr:BamA/TamA family outer membrane protein [Myxococcales bacterium]